MEIEFSLSIIVRLCTRCTFRDKENNDMVEPAWFHLSLFSLSHFPARKSNVDRHSECVRIDDIRGIALCGTKLKMGRNMTES